MPSNHRPRLTAVVVLAWSSHALADERATPSSDAEDIEAMRDAAQTALDNQDFALAQAEFDRILVLAPHDAAAQRNAGRAAMAAGNFTHGVRVLERSHHFGGHHRDPELHYLRGEGLYALDRQREARAEHRIAELEMGSGPYDRMSSLWLARIHARRGNIALADTIYESLWPFADEPPDAEVAINQAEAHLLVKDWWQAGRVLRRFLERSPNHHRARQMLAWTLEARGDLDAELAVRSHLAADWSSPTVEQEFGRALERAHDDRGAYTAYLRASELAVGPEASLVKARERMRDRTTPEVGAMLSTRSDPAATGQHLQAGVAVPFGPRHLASLLGWYDSTNRRFPAANASVSAISASLVLATRWGGRLTLAGQMRSLDRMSALDGQSPQEQGGARLAWGETAAVETPLGKLVKVDLRGENDAQWNDASIAVHEGGSVTSLTGHVFVTPIPSTQRFLIDSGAQVRKLRLETLGGTPAARPTASQTLMWVGADIVLWHDSSRILPGQILDDDLLRNTEIADSVTLSYRHYELYGESDPTFLARIALVDRSSADIGSLVARTTLDTQWLALAVRAGMGYDRARGRTLSQTGASLFAMVTARSRLMLSYDLARETSVGLAGTRHTGWLTYHADL